MARLMREFQIAFLGPSGTYGETAAKHFQRRLRGGTLVPCPTIPSVYAHPAAYLVLPIHNTIHGVVTDTADCLLSIIKDRNAPRVVADTALEISHQLVALKGVKLEDVKWVRSHEQALGQSRVWLDEHLPKAERVNWPSTAGAAQSLIDEGSREGAAICSRAAVDLLGLDVLYSGTQGAGNENYTQFVLLRRPEEEVREIITRRSGSRAGYFACSTGVGLESVQRIGKEAYVWPRPAQDGEGSWTLVKRVDVGHELGKLEGAVCVGIYDVETLVKDGKPIQNPGDIDWGYDDDGSQHEE